MNHQKQRASSKQIRVLIAAPSLDINGGQARQAVRLIEKLSREPEIEVSFIPHNPRLPRSMRWMQQIKYVRTVATTTVYIAMLIARVWRYDIVHVFSASYYSYLLSALPAILIAKLYGRKTILNYRSGEAEDHLANWRTAVPTIRLADVTVVPSGYLVEVFARFGLRARAIFNTVETDRFRYRKRSGVRPVFLTSRLLEPLYNVACALRAFAIIQARYPEARLTIAADGSLREELERLARDLKLRDAQFIGFVSFEDMPALYDAADIYLNTNDIDNMPSSLIECMAAGVNIVTTNAGGIPYIVTDEETGLIVPCGDHEAMARSAMRFLEDTQMAAQTAARAHDECRKYNWATARREWLGLYKELANRRVAVSSNHASAAESL
ncbi:MAG: glycosyltransferase family 4 protein [Blastocatellia bacterium]